MKKERIVAESELTNPLDLWKWMGSGGKSKRVLKNGVLSPESLLAVFKDRLTYTFILEKEVASIHFDRKKKEIYFSGRNLYNLQLSKPQLEALNGLKQVLKGDSRGEPFLSDYEATLRVLLADNNKGSKPSGRRLG